MLQKLFLNCTQTPETKKLWREVKSDFATLCVSCICLDSKLQQVVKAIRQQASTPPRMDGSMVYARWRQCAPHLIHASLCPVPNQVKLPNSISIGAAVFAQVTAEIRYTLQRPFLFPLKIATSHGLPVWTPI